MKILIIGEEQQFSEAQTKLGTNHQYVWLGNHDEADSYVEANDVVFDFIIDENPTAFDLYASNNVTVFVNTAKISLAELVHYASGDMLCTTFGFNGLPTLFNRAVMECALLDRSSESALLNFARAVNSEVLVVDDRVGLVTPRVIAMIINEAYYAMQDGTATAADIDNAMKLGTNYPYGPIEWAERIGIKHIYEVLEAVYDDTKDERYKICPLLKKRYLKTTMGLL